MIRHPLDPLNLLQACDTYGLLVAQGVVEMEDAVTSVLGIFAGRTHPELDPGSFRTRVCWGVREAADAWDRNRRRTEWAIKRGIEPLLEAWAEPAEILNRAYEINDAAGTSWGKPLLVREIRPLVAEEMRWRLRARSKGRTRSRHVG